MTHRQPYLGLYTLLVGLFCLSFGYNIHLYTKLQALENSTHFTRCGTSEYEFRKLQDEIKRLENNPFDNNIHWHKPIIIKSRDKQGE